MIATPSQNRPACNVRGLMDALTEIRNSKHQGDCVARPTSACHPEIARKALVAYESTGKEDDPKPPHKPKPDDWPDPPWWSCEYCATRAPDGCAQHSYQIAEYEMHGYESWPTHIQEKLGIEPYA